MASIRTEDCCEPLLEDVPDALLVICDEGNIVLVNAATERMFGYQRDELLGRRSDLLLPEAFTSHLRQIRADFASDPGMSRLGSNPLGVDLDLYGRRKDGTEFPVEVSCCPVRTGSGIKIGASVRDVSGRHRGETELRNTLSLLRATLAELTSADARFRSLVESSGDAIISATPDGFVTSWNAAAERLLGYSRQEILGQSVDLLVPLDRRVESVDIRRFAVSQGSGQRRYETERSHKDGTRVAVSLTASPISDGYKITGVSNTLRDITDSVVLRHEVGHRALHDTLTGLPNRELLAKRIEQALVADVVAGTCTGLLVIDLNRFKEVNDIFGHQCGDDLLRQVGPRLAGVLADGDTVARLFGDQFAVLLPNRNDINDATSVAFTLAAALGMPFHVQGVDLDVEARIGVAISGAHGEDATKLLQHANIALGVARTQTQGVFTYDPAVHSSSPSRLALLGDLRRAIERGELVLHYQPKVSLSTGQVVGVEALVRWQHPERGLIFPDNFIPMAEYTALIGPLTQYVLNTALAQARIWIDAGKPLPIAVNLSVRNLLDEQLADRVAELLALHEVPAALLELEVTESAIMIDPVKARLVLEQLSALGVRISIDDFGAGYTSLSQLTTLPLSELKIDRSFVMRMIEDPGNAMIVQSVIDLGHNLDLTLVAEGVETEQALKALAGLECDIAQGYHLCKPLPVADFDMWCAEGASSLAV